MVKEKISVIGQGYVGLPLSARLVAKNFAVIGVDSNKYKVQELHSGNFDLMDKDKTLLSRGLKVGSYFPTSNFSDIKGSKVIIICVPTPLNTKFEPDLSIVEKVVRDIKPYIGTNTLLILESTVSSGFTREIKKKYFNATSYLSIDLAFSPERIDPLNKKWDVKNTPKLVAGLTDKARDRAVEFYSKFIDTVIPCSSLEVAETAKLLENSFRLINISFINELAIFCNKIGIDVQEVIKAASTKPYGFMPFYPSVGIGGHCIPVDPVYLSHKAKEVGAPTSFIDLATKVNHEMPKYFVKRASQMLGKVKNKKVLVLGVSYKPNISDVRETPVEALIDGLRKKGAKVKWHDDIVKKWRGEKSAEITAKYDLAIIATPHDYFDLKKLGNTKILNTRSSI